MAGFWHNIPGNGLGSTGQHEIAHGLGPDYDLQPVDLFAAAVSGIVTQVSDLTTEITAAASVSSTVTAEAALITPALLAASITSSASAVSDLTTEITLATNVAGRVRAKTYTVTYNYLRGVLQLAPLDIDPLANGIMNLTDLIHMTDIWGGYAGLEKIPAVVPHLITMKLAKSKANVKLTGKDVTMKLTKSEFDVSC